MIADRHDEPFLQVTVADGVATGIVDPAHATALCAGHFPGQPLVPGAALAGLMAELGARLLSRQGPRVRPIALSRCTFAVSVTPAEPITVLARVDRAGDASVEAEVRVAGTRAAAAAIRFAPR